MFDKHYDRVVIDNPPTVGEELFSRTQRDSKSLTTGNNLPIKSKDLVFDLTTNDFIYRSLRVAEI